MFDLERSESTDAFAAAWSDPVSRRNLLRAAGVGLGAAAVGGMLTACTADAPDDTATGKGSPGAAAASMSVALGNVFLGLDPTTGDSFGTIALNDALEALLDKALAAPDDETRRTLLAQAQDLVQEQSPLAPLHHKRQLTGWSALLQGFRPLLTVGLSFEGVRG